MHTHSSQYTAVANTDLEEAGKPSHHEEVFYDPPSYTDILRSDLERNAISAGDDDAFYGPPRWLKKAFVATMYLALMTLFFLLIQQTHRASSSIGLWPLEFLGNIALSLGERGQLGLKTAPIPDRPDEYMVTLAMFQQLKCLDYLRLSAYKGGSQDDDLSGSQLFQDEYLDYCLDYLRQAIMCHGDLTPIPMQADPSRSPPYTPKFETKQICRNFDSIREFAEKRNTTGVRVE